GRALVRATLVPTAAAQIMALNTNDLITIRFYFPYFLLRFLWIRRRRGKNVAPPLGDNRQTAHNHRPMKARLDEKTISIDKPAGIAGQKITKNQYLRRTGDTVPLIVHRMNKRLCIRRIFLEQHKWLHTPSGKAQFT